MSRRGRPPASTEEQYGRVVALAGEGHSQRQIAELVFGDERFRGRVERILRKPPSRQMDSGPGDVDARVDFDELLASEGEMGTVVELVARYERRIVESGEVPALAEIERLLRIKGQLSVIATIERHKPAPRQPV